MRKGFTLLELIVVIIIIGILATLGFMQYAQMVERGRRAEARMNLGTLRQLQIAWSQDGAANPTGAYTADVDMLTGGGLPDTNACDGEH